MPEAGMTMQYEIHSTSEVSLDSLRTDGKRAACDWS
jgi:hypothetical protein